VGDVKVLERGQEGQESEVWRRPQAKTQEEEGQEEVSDDTTDPNISLLGKVFDELKDMRQENRTEHKAITGEINQVKIDVACLQTKWRFLKWAIPASVALVGGMATMITLLGG